MKTVAILLLLASLFTLAGAAEHTIHIQNEQVSIKCPATWVIIAHQPVGSPADIVAFQIPNPADDGTDDSTNLSVTAFDVRDTEAMLKFTQPLLAPQKGAPPAKEIGEWALITQTDKQGATEYEIRDCYRTMGTFGLHVRLAFPKLSKTTKEWQTKLEADFKKLLDSIMVQKIK